MVAVEEPQLFLAEQMAGSGTERIHTGRHSVLYVCFGVMDGTRRLKFLLGRLWERIWELVLWTDVMRSEQCVSWGFCIDGMRMLTFGGKSLSCSHRLKIRNLDVPLLKTRSWVMMVLILVAVVTARVVLSPSYMVREDVKLRQVNSDEGFRVERVPWVSDVHVQNGRLQHQKLHLKGCDYASALSTKRFGRWKS